jgi:hypothetical protein
VRDEARLAAPFTPELAEVEAEFRRYLEGGIPYVAIELPPLSRARWEVTPLPEADKLVLLADLAAQVSGRRSLEPERMLRRALELDPQHPGALVALAQRLARRRDPEAGDLLARAQEASDDDARLEAALGEITARRARRAPREERAALWGSARAHLRRALELAPGHAGAAIDLARSYLETDDDPGDALPLLAEVQRRRSGVLELDAVLAELYLARGARDAARRLLSELVAELHAEQTPSPGQAARLARLLERAGLPPAGSEPGVSLQRE